jgi:hypothetical protein
LRADAFPYCGTDCGQIVPLEIQDDPVGGRQSGIEVGVGRLGGALGHVRQRMVVGDEQARYPRLGGDGAGLVARGMAAFGIMGLPCLCSNVATPATCRMVSGSNSVSVQ